MKKAGRRGRGSDEDGAALGFQAVPERVRELVVADSIRVAIGHEVRLIRRHQIAGARIVAPGADVP